MFIASCLERHARRPARTSPRPSFLPTPEALDKRVVPSTLTVTNNLAFGAGSLQAEIAAAQSGDTIVFAQGIGSTIIVGSNDNGPTQFEINKNLDIQGPGATMLAISGGRSSRVFEVDAGAQLTLSGLTIENGGGTTGGGIDPDPNDGKGGGILNLGALTLSNCVVTGNNDIGGGIAVLDLGGGIYNAGALTLSGTAVTNNTAGSGGGIDNAGTMTMSGCTATGNTATSGGGIYNTGALTVIGSTVTQNTASFSKYDDLFNIGTLSASSSTIGKKKYH